MRFAMIFLCCVMTFVVTANASEPPYQEGGAKPYFSAKPVIALLLKTGGAIPSSYFTKMLEGYVDTEKLHSKWKKLGNSQKIDEFLVLKVFRGSFEGGDSLTAKQVSVISSLTVTGSKYVTFLNKSGNQFFIESYGDILKYQTCDVVPLDWVLEKGISLEKLLQMNDDQLIDFLVEEELVCYGSPEDEGAIKRLQKY